MGWPTVLAFVLVCSGWVSFGLMTLRVSGLRQDVDEADSARLRQAEELRDLAENHNRYTKRQVARLKDLENEITGLENELALCVTPGSRRNALNRLLQAASSARAESEDKLSR